MESKDIVAENLIYYRKKSGLSQLELAQKLSYSNKNISKWENGETTPNVFVLKNIADLFGITVDDLLKQPSETDKETYTDYVGAINKHKKIRNFGFLFLANAILYTLICIAILVLGLCQITSFNKWILFLYATPLSCLSVFIFVRCIYKRIDVISLSLFGWLLALCVYVSLSWVKNIVMVFVVAGAYQILIIFITLVVNLKLIDKFAISFKQLKEKYNKKKVIKEE